jgi:hypothetical protein
MTLTGRTVSATTDGVEPAGANACWLDRRHLTAMGVPAAAAAAVFVAAHRGLTDDALITLSYARTLGLHGDWGMIPGVRANSQTSPLQALLLGGTTAVVRSVIVACGLVWIASMVVIGGLVDGLARRLGYARWAGPAAGLLIATSPLIVSTIGLETGLAVALISALAYCIVVTRGPVAAGMVCGLLVLARPDLVVFVVLGAVLTASQEPVKESERARWGYSKAPWNLTSRSARALVTTAVAIVVTLPWFAWSWYFLGSAIPDTLAFKAGAGAWHDRLGGDTYQAITMANGYKLYFAYHRIATMVVAGAVVLGAAGAVWMAVRGGPGRRVAVLLGGGAAGYHLTMITLDAGPHAWYFGPSTGALMLVGVLAAAGVPGRSSLLVVAALTVTTAISTFGRQLPWPTAPIGGNYATAKQYAAVARELPAANMASPGEVGALVFYCDGRCRVLDGFSDQGTGARTIRKQIDHAHGLRGWLVRLNYTHYHPTPPVPVTYRLWFRDGAIPVPETPAVRSWPIDSRWHPRGQISLHLLTDSPWD